MTRLKAWLEEAVFRLFLAVLLLVCIAGVFIDRRRNEK